MVREHCIYFSTDRQYRKRDSSRAFGTQKIDDSREYSTYNCMDYVISRDIVNRTLHCRYLNNK